MILLILFRTKLNIPVIAIKHGDLFNKRKHILGSPQCLYNREHHQFSLAGNMSKYLLLRAAWVLSTQMFLLVQRVFYRGHS